MNVSCLAEIEENDRACPTIFSCPTKCISLANEYDSNNTGLFRSSCSASVNVLRSCDSQTVQYVSESGSLDRDLVHIQQLVSMVTEYDKINAGIVRILCNAEVIGDGDSSVQSSDEWECLASHDADMICLPCQEDSCTLITHVQYMQYYRDLCRHLGYMSGSMTTETELVASYLEGVEDEIMNVEQLMSTTQHVILVIQKLIEDGLFLVVEQGELPEDRILRSTSCFT